MTLSSLRGEVEAVKDRTMLTVPLHVVKDADIIDALNKLAEKGINKAGFTRALLRAELRKIEKEKSPHGARDLSNKSEIQLL